MDFRLNEKQLELQAKVRKFAQERLLPTVVERDNKGEYPTELYKEMGAMGLIGLPYPKEFGGQGEDYLSYAIAVEEISKVDASLGISYSVCTSLYGGSVMNSNATDAQKKEFLPDVLQGKAWGSFGLTEPNAGSDAGGCVTTAAKDGDGYVLNGLKCFNTNGPLADYSAVFALTEPELKAKGLACFVVKKGTPGFSVGRIEDKMGIRQAQVSELIFDNCRVPESAMIAPTGQGFKLAMKALDGGRIGVAAQGLGIAEGAFDTAVEYMKTREQFGKPIFKNQYLAFKMAKLKMEIEAAKLMLYKAATDKDTGAPYGESAAMAKYLCTNAAMHVTTECVQFMGGNGYMKGYHVERMMRDAKITQIYEGTNEIQQLIISGGIFR